MSASRSSASSRLHAARERFSVEPDAVALDGAPHELMVAWYHYRGLPVPAPESLLADLAERDPMLAPRAEDVSPRPAAGRAPILMPCGAPLPGEPEWPAEPAHPRRSASHLLDRAE
jgi:hypothetical protein